MKLKKKTTKVPSTQRDAQFVFEPIRRTQNPFTNLSMLPAFEIGTADLDVSGTVRALADVNETESDVIVEFDLPGVDKKDIELTVSEHAVTVTAEKKSEEERMEKKRYRYERSYSGYYRSLTLPARINPDKTVTAFENGVLKLTMPKLERGIRSKKLTIK